MSAPAVDWSGVESAIHGWIVAATGIPGSRVYHVEPALDGVALPVVPAAQIQYGAMVPRFQPEIRKVPGIVLVRITVASAGPGSAGLVFYPGDSLTGQTLAVVALADQSPATIAAALLAELSANLPAGYSASADPANPAAVLVTGSTGSPLFAAANLPGSPLSIVTVVRERYVEIDCAWTRFSWRVLFRSNVARGPGSPSDMLTSARMTVRRKLAPALHRVGHRFAGVQLAAPNLPEDRGEFRAALDFSTEGYATRASMSPAARQIGFDVQP